jgi:hypothetical protein
VILSVCALLTLAEHVLPEAANVLVTVTCEFASGKPGVGVAQVVRALLALQESARGWFLSFFLFLFFLFA